MTPEVRHALNVTLGAVECPDNIAEFTTAVNALVDSGILVESDDHDLYLDEKKLESALAETGDEIDQLGKERIVLFIKGATDNETVRKLMGEEKS